MSVADDLAEIEREVGALPAVYRSFLERFEGPRDAWPGRHGWLSTVKGRWLIGLLYEPAQVRKRLRMTPAPLGSLTIADDGGGDSYMMHVSTGEVRCWQHEVNDWGDPWGLLAPLGCDIAEIIRQVGDAPEPPSLARIVAHSDVATIEALVRVASEPSRPELLRELARHAISAGRLDVLRWCVGAGAPTERMLHLAARKTNIDVVAYLLDEVGLNIDEYDSRFSTTPLVEARRFAPTTADYLRSRGAK